MALEDNVKELTLAIYGLTKALEAQTLAVAGGEPEPAKKQTIQKPSTPKESEEKSAPAVVKEEAASTTSTATDELEVDLAPDVTLTQLAEVFTTLVEVNRPVAVGLLKEYKLAKISVADPSLYSELFQKVTDLVNG